jgi:photosynthetic reaction center H subunit
MPKGTITEYMDVAQMVLYAFWLFFAGLIYYLRQEDRREGYPLESEVFGRSDKGFLLIPDPKIFHLSDGTEVEAPRDETETRVIRAAKVADWPGAPLVPTGNPLADGVGPASYALRSDKADVTFDGLLRIVPLRVAKGYFLESRDPDPRGMPVYGADGAVAGSITEIWVDRAESIIRYYEVEVTADGSRRHVLLPINFAVVSAWQKKVTVDSILASQFAGVPAIRSPDTVTRLEEERVCAYYGGGYLYATPSRAEPLL